MKNWQALLLSLSLLFGSTAKAKITDPLRYLPVQDAGRLKPYDTFARESLELIYGKTSYKGKDAVEVVTTWMMIPEPWESIEFIEIRNSGVREALRLDSKRVLFSPKEIMLNDRLALIIQELRGIREQGEKLNPYFQDVQRLENQMAMLQSIHSGMAVRPVPQADKDSWLGANELPEELREKFSALLGKFVQALGAELDGSAAKIGETDLQAALEDFKSAARAQAPEKYPSDRRISLEVHFNKFHPFKWAWMAYLLGVVFFVATGVSQKDRWQKWAWVGLSLGFLLHAYGMVLRIYLAERPPVSNMYETVVWVPFGAVVFATLLYYYQRQRLLLIAASVISILCLVLTDLAPTVLDDGIHPLEPVLRSTFWLTTHVLIITISYAAFFLAFALGDYILFLFLRDEKKYHAEIQSGVLACYRAIQIGVVLLAGGIILGGVWADYSWGRFWGWDPKETWALIALLGYVALLHGRLAGWVKSFGMAAGSVVSFSLVIMAWYGVNFVLGAGLHSYGFGAGGVEYVSAFVAIHLAYVTFVGTVRKSRLASQAQK